MPNARRIPMCHFMLKRVERACVVLVERERRVGALELLREQNVSADKWGDEITTTSSSWRALVGGRV